MNQFNEQPMALYKMYMNWKEIYPKSYDKNNVDPYTNDATKDVLKKEPKFRLKENKVLY